MTTSDWPAGGAGPDDPERTVDPKVAPLLAGGDTRVPAAIRNDPVKLSQYAMKTNLQLQRAAASAMRRMKKLRLFGPDAEDKPQFDDQVGIQLMFQLRNVIDRLGELPSPDDETSVKIQAVQTHLAGLRAMADLNNKLLAEITRITHSSNVALTSLARIELERKKIEAGESIENLSDAELA